MKDFTSFFSYTLAVSAHFSESDKTLVNFYRYRNRPTFLQMSVRPTRRKKKKRTQKTSEYSQAHVKYIPE